ncbi:TetR/AcrR family transcriptional regulator [Cellulomonas sp. KRMCY2]|uniref:TetR/AcrR family transcriptional regulator n=1 Tax=Cellulomonas sp. KRMCY2 TaxID=1304865 RepID=UPI00045EB8E7|nr:TetR/AcrR family transcriptional regulator [Cellulomonas sp. KRMCY2]
MSPDIPAPDRRAALKQRHRRAIVDAAASFMAEQEGVGFTVDDLATRADVARRTVFNHFASVDDIVAAVCADVLGGVVDSFVAQVSAAPAAQGSASSMFDEVAHALRTTDLVTPMAYLTRTLGNPDEQSPWRAALLLRSFHDVSERFSAAMAARHPDADLLDVQLLVNSLMSGLMMLYGHWFALTGAADDEPARHVWAGLVDRLVETVRGGYGTPAHDL